MIQLVECPRDALQGWPRMVPAAEKIAYYEQLLQVGFHTVDIGSFVSPKAIPQMADTAEVLAALQGVPTQSKLLAIVANERGGEQALSQPLVHYLGFPFSLSPTFQQRNTNSTQQESATLVRKLQASCASAGKELVVYLSMGFGNPYGDDYDAQLIGFWAEQFASMGVTHLSLADTVGLASPSQVQEAVSFMKDNHPQIITSVHLHCSPANWRPKLQAALAAGCNRVDAALGGYGGCPMAQDNLVGNMATEHVLHFCQEQDLPLQTLNLEAFARSQQMAAQIFAHS